jgi:predicted RNA polymerase sigma factor
MSGSFALSAFSLREAAGTLASHGVDHRVVRHAHKPTLRLCRRPLTRAAQIALMLNVTFGLTVGQIATAFVTDERTVAPRLRQWRERNRPIQGESTA